MTELDSFFMGHEPKDLVKQFSSPVYVYNETILRNRLKQMKKLINYPRFRVNYSPKANSNLALLQIVRDEGVTVDAMSPGEVAIEEIAGFKTHDIFYVSNNLTKEEMEFVIEKNLYLSVDSLNQLDLYGQLNPGGEVSLRVNIIDGVGHHEKVVTAGKNTKFGITLSELEKARNIAGNRQIKITGLNHHLGSLFMDNHAYLAGMKAILSISLQFPDMRFIDFGGGFGIPYHRNKNELPLDMACLSMEMNKIINEFVTENPKEYEFAVEPGRYIVGEAGVILGQVTDIKYNEETKFIGTDIGFNNLMRPVLYDSYHEIEIFSPESDTEIATVVGNICESGDILAKNRLLPKGEIGDIVAVLDAGAYGFSMSSNYNGRLRPAEILIQENGELVIIRRREIIDDLLATFIPVATKP